MTEKSLDSLLLVIPAKAGIHFAVAFAFVFHEEQGKVKMDPGFRRDDDICICCIPNP
ncbi:MAG TPA: hypothetical protein VGQ93_15235 [Lysobacter sp.]|jgi:hypothetical protein|nr:hypothetical protein [Lysobacter sp.]